jgi:hypothetical protein
MVSPKNELAQANHYLVYAAGLATLKASWSRLFLAEMIKVSKQFLISWSLLEVRISVMRASGQIYYG